MSNTITTNITEEKVNENLMKLYVLGSTITQDIALLQLSDPHYDENGNIDENDDQVINILIDSGMGVDREKEMIAESGKTVPTLKKHIEVLHDLKISKIDYIYITHFHYDHVKGLEDIINGYINTETGENYAAIDTQNAVIFLPENPNSKYTSVNYYINLVYELAQSKNMTVVIPGHTAGAIVGSSNNYSVQETADTKYLRNKTIFKIGQNQELELDFRNYNTSIYYDEETGIPNDYNDTCLCCIMRFGSNRIGFFGDIDYTAQNQLTGEIGHLDLMNVEHHGLNGGYYRPFFDSIAPKMCFTQNGYKEATRDYIYLAERCKTHAYLQENGIPNFATSVNGTMVFNIYKSGITTDAVAIKYANGINGVTSIVGAINNTTTGYNFTNNKKMSLFTLLKNMEHGTFLSTKLESSSWFDPLWKRLTEGLVDSDVTNSQLIVYKGGSSSYNQSEDGTTYPDSGYIVLIPHTSDDLIGPIFSHWYAKKDYTTISLKLKPITRNGLFKFAKETTKTTVDEELDEVNYFTCRELSSGEKSSYGLDSGFIIIPKKNCTVNFSVYFRNLNSTATTIKYYDGEVKKTVSLPAKSGITIPNCAVLSSNLSLKKTITIPNTDNVYVKVCGTVTYSNTKSKAITADDDYIIKDFPKYNSYPLF